MTSMKRLLYVLIFLTLTGYMTEGRLNQGRTDKCDYSNETLVWEVNATDYEYVHLNCSAKAVNFKLNHSIFDWFHVKYIDYLILVDANKDPFSDPICRANKSSDGYYKFNLHDPEFGKCSKNISLSKNGSCIYVNYTICVVPDFHGYNITRDSEVYITFSCVYSRTLRVYLKPLKPYQDSEKYIVPYGPVIDTAIRIYRTSDTFETKDTSDTVLDGYIVYLKACLKVDARWNITLQAQYCYATPTADSSDTYRYDIIEDGCPATDALGLNDANNVNLNFMGDKVEFSFTAFHWRHLPAIGQKIYVHCYIDICDMDTQDCSNPIGVCPLTRRRRSISDKDLEDAKLVTAGPFEIIQEEKKEPKCDKAAMGCHFACAVGAMGDARCICPIGAVLEFDGKRCLYLENGSEEVVQPNTTLEMLPILNSALIVGFVLSAVVSIVASYVRRRAKK